MDLPRRANLTESGQIQQDEQERRWHVPDDLVAVEGNFAERGSSSVATLAIMPEVSDPEGPKRQPSDLRDGAEVRDGADVPDAVRAQALAAYAQVSDRGELLKLVYDSLADGATPSDRFWLVFQHPGAQLQLSITATDSGWDLSSRLDAPEQLRVELELDGSELALVAQAKEGVVVFRGVMPGVMRLVLTCRGEPRQLRTDWFLLGARPRS